jgi:hypothetical protein
VSASAGAAADGPAGLVFFDAGKPDVRVAVLVVEADGVEAAAGDRAFLEAPDAVRASGERAPADGRRGPPVVRGADRSGLRGRRGDIGDDRVPGIRVRHRFVVLLSRARAGLAA